MVSFGMLITWTLDGLQIGECVPTNRGLEPFHSRISANRLRGTLNWLPVIDCVDKTLS